MGTVVGWDVLNEDYLRQLREVQIAEAKVDANLRLQVEMLMPLMAMRFLMCMCMWLRKWH